MDRKTRKKISQAMKARWRQKRRTTFYLKAKTDRGEFFGKVKAGDWETAKMRAKTLLEDHGLSVPRITRMSYEVVGSNSFFLPEKGLPDLGYEFWEMAGRGEEFEELISRLHPQ